MKWCCCFKKHNYDKINNIERNNTIRKYTDNKCSVVPTSNINIDNVTNNSPLCEDCYQKGLLSYGTCNKCGAWKTY